MKQAAVMVIVIGVLVVLAQLAETLAPLRDSSAGVASAPALPPDLDTTFDGVRY